ncbi:hypothetical protein [Bacillus massiliglaciei]|uniref:hypothetical protein n=1 Tax=Bacillus massiliglaciei TaxID=1816693 RepID=UPI000DA609CD|nr:hypothetical protein [Bacillus massiliglaciei]
MFDPTAFENMKVVIEGAVYDRDLIGDILVTDREETVNLSKLSRNYSIEFELKHETKQTMEKKIRGTLTLNASLANLAAELLTSQVNEKEAGSSVEISIWINIRLSEKEISAMKQELERIWGTKRLIELTVTENQNNQAETSCSSAWTIRFGRLVTEDQMDDLEDMTEYLIQSLEMTEKIVSR